MFQLCQNMKHVMTLSHTVMTYNKVPGLKYIAILNINICDETCNNQQFFFLFEMYIWLQTKKLGKCTT